ncbi:MAG TPA: hypothetical protein VNG90_05095 [Candidatus Acidoferrum sp.]|nr:hypothetical protein [Candidatus Acidoferrum sp.]
MFANLEHFEAVQLCFSSAARTAVVVTYLQKEEASAYCESDIAKELGISLEALRYHLRRLETGLLSPLTNSHRRQCHRINIKHVKILYDSLQQLAQHFGLPAQNEPSGQIPTGDLVNGGVCFFFSSESRLRTALALLDTSIHGKTDWQRAEQYGLPKKLFSKQKTTLQDFGLIVVTSRFHYCVSDSLVADWCALVDLLKSHIAGD